MLGRRRTSFRRESGCLWLQRPTRAAGSISGEGSIAITSRASKAKLRASGPGPKIEHRSWELRPVTSAIRRTRLVAQRLTWQSFRMQWCLGSILCLISIATFAQANDAALSEIERDASYCYGVASQRYANYILECKGKEDCNLFKGMRAAAAGRDIIAVYLKRQGFLIEGTRSDADKAEQTQVQRRGAEDHKTCVDYTSRTVHGCIVYCLDKPNEGRCLRNCQVTRGDPQACERLQLCNDPFSPVPVK